jgi:hypothetical protein
MIHFLSETAQIKLKDLRTNQEFINKKVLKIISSEEDLQLINELLECAIKDVNSIVLIQNKTSKNLVLSKNKTPRTERYKRTSNPTAYLIMRKDRFVAVYNNYELGLKMLGQLNAIDPLEEDKYIMSEVEMNNANEGARLKGF